MLRSVLTRFAVVLVLLSAGLAGMAVAQSPEQASASGGLIADQRANLDGLKKKIDDLEAKIDGAKEDDAALVEIRLQLDDVGDAALKSGLAFDRAFPKINARIEQLVRRRRRASRRSRTSSPASAPR